MANRRAVLYLLGVLDELYVTRGPAHVASTLYVYQWEPGLGFDEKVFDATSIIRVHLPAFDFFQSWRIITATEAMAAGDNWGAPMFEVEEWIEE